MFSDFGLVTEKGQVPKIELAWGELKNATEECGRRLSLLNNRLKVAKSHHQSGTNDGERSLLSALVKQYKNL